MTPDKAETACRMHEMGYLWLDIAKYLDVDFRRIWEAIKGRRRWGHRRR
jgi:hypothetical protein